jgi:hypothetical protein
MAIRINTEKPQIKNRLNTLSSHDIPYAPIARHRTGLSLGITAALLPLIALSGLSAAKSMASGAPLMDNYLFDNGSAQAALAEQAIIQNKPKTAADYAQKAIAKNLGDVIIIRSMAMAAQAQKDDAKAEKLFAVSSRLSKRDGPTQIKLFEYAIKRNDYKSAIDNADVLMRRRVVSDQMIDIFLLAGQVPGLAQNIAAKLNTAPSWRPTFFQSKIGADEAKRGGFERIVLELKKLSSPATQAEMATYVSGLAANKADPSRGLRLWNFLYPKDNAIVTGDKAIELGWPTDARFEKPLPTDWRFINNSKAFPAINSNAGKLTPELEIDAQAGASGVLAIRWLILPVGTMQIAVPKLQGNAASLSWYISCADGSQKTILSPGTGNVAKWSGFVPSGCGAHMLGIELGRSRLVGDQRLAMDTVMISVTR